ncbi:MAG: cation:proton antiporter [Candidatus Omnitrophica bacterium]|nr:cation:proton antiporter [Candidatus Omnitrophota bacterium]
MVNDHKEKIFERYSSERVRAPRRGFKRVRFILCVLMFLFVSAWMLPSEVLASGAPAGEGQDLPGRMALLMIQLSVILFSAWMGGNFFKRYSLPGVLGEIVAGIIIGPYLLGHVPLPGFSDGIFPLQPHFPVSGELYGIATIASIILLFLVGIETDIDTFLRFSFVGTTVGVSGVISSFVAGDLVAVFMSKIIFGQSYGFMHPIPLFLGVISTATSVGISARILSEHRKIDSPEGITILSSAVIDDVLGIITLAIVVGIVRSGYVEWRSISVIAFKAIGIWLGFTIAGLFFARHIGRFLKMFKERNAIAIMGFALSLLLAGLFEKSGLAMIIGAYTMGLSLSKTDLSYLIQEKLSMLNHFFVPIFFCTMGMLVNLKEMASGSILLFSSVYILVAFVSKFMGCALPAWCLNFNIRGATIVGVGMVPRGEVALIIAGIALSTGVIPHDIFSVAVIMTFITTLVTPPVLSRLVASDKPVLKKAQAKKKEYTEIRYSMPNRDTAELVLNKLINAFENEGFYVHRLEMDRTVFQIRKNETFITLRYSAEEFVFESVISESSYVHTLFYEIITDLEMAMKNLQKSLDKDAIGRNIFHTLHDGKTSSDSSPTKYHFISPLAVERYLRSHNKNDVIEELTDLLIKSGQLTFKQRRRVIKDLLEREALMSTGMQDGIAIPHAKTAAVKHMYIAIGIKRKGVEFNSLDKKPAQIFVLTVVPKDSPEPYLKFISDITRFLANEENRRRILTADKNIELYNIFTHR